LKLVERLEDPRLQTLQDHAVRPLDLSVRLWVCNSRPIQTNVIVIAKLEEFLPRELGAIVGDDRVGYAEAVDDVGEERDRLLGADVDDGSSLDPLRELVDRYEEVGKALGCLSEWTHHVEGPNCEGPRDGDRLQCLRRDMSLPGVELAFFAVTHNVLRVGDRCRPVKTLSEGFPNKCSRSGMVATRAGMYLLQ
jgi:hypothetical protein